MSFLPEASWVSVSSMATTEEDLLPDNQKTAFDWCKDGKLEPMRKCMNEKKVDSNSSDDEGNRVIYQEMNMLKIYKSIMSSNRFRHSPE